MDPRIIGAVEKMLAAGNFPGAVAFAGLGVVMYVISVSKKK